jgi:hypothetical protein
MLSVLPPPAPVMPAPSTKRMRPVFVSTSDVLELEPHSHNPTPHRICLVSRMAALTPAWVVKAFFWCR